MTLTFTPQNFNEQVQVLQKLVLEQGTLSLHPVPEKSKKSSFTQKMEDPENTSYGPMSMDDFAKEMKSWIK
jgi:hypothetical protein